MEHKNHPSHRSSLLSDWRRSARRRKTRAIVILIVASIILLTCGGYFIAISTGLGSNKDNLLRTAFKRLGHRDRVATLLEKDPETGRLLDALDAPNAPPDMVVIDLTFGDLLLPTAGSIERKLISESEACNAEAGTQTATQRFSVLPIGTVTRSVTGAAVGSINRQLLEAVFAQARAGRLDETPVLGVSFPGAGGGGLAASVYAAQRRRLVFGTSSSGVAVQLLVDLSSGRLLAGSADRAVEIAVPHSQRCWEALRNRRVESQPEQVHRFLAPLTLKSVRVTFNEQQT